MRYIALVLTIIIGLSALAFAQAKSDAAGIRALFPAKYGACTQKVDHISTQGAYALATVVQGGNCDFAAVWILHKAGAWRKLGAIGGVPDVCSVYHKGVPLAYARPLVAKFTGMASSTTSC